MCSGLSASPPSLHRPPPANKAGPARDILALNAGAAIYAAGIADSHAAGVKRALDVISSGAAIGGSPLSGGYAGAKRTQMFLADYAQKESARLQLGLQFLALTPGRIMPETELGKAAIEAYASSLGISPADFIKNMGAKVTTEDVANAVVTLASDSRERAGKTFLVSASGIELLS